MNLWAQFKTLFPAAPLLVGEVVVSQDGISQIRLPGGAIVVVRGEGVPVGAMAFMRDGVLEGPAPALTPVDIVI